MVICAVCIFVFPDQSTVRGRSWVYCQLGSGRVPLGACLCQSNQLEHGHVPLEATVSGADSALRVSNQGAFSAASLLNHVLNGCEPSC